ncbi:hypothetical protein QBC32DRAFT_117086 [Pseudoneurospora amorphoporcata]|uniref:Secreted protein n=1 Tax=Pseudoneurospora amorphoporcata TaxID=241081 RepID=A0AAN6NYI9_9PEZI|nr:hypothetical protein QBC32DRAFT_117086 [Pseudoneurospora amorphoporcata]
MILMVVWMITVTARRASSPIHFSGTFDLPRIRAPFLLLMSACTQRLSGSRKGVQILGSARTIRRYQSPGKRSYPKLGSSLLSILERYVVQVCPAWNILCLRGSPRAQSRNGRRGSRREDDMKQSSGDLGFVEVRVSSCEQRDYVCGDGDSELDIRQP